MKWVTYLHPNWKTSRAGLVYHNHILDLQYTLHLFDQASQKARIEQLPKQLLEYMDQQEAYQSILVSSLETINHWSEEEWGQHKAGNEPWVFAFDLVQLYAPLQHPRSVRDFMRSNSMSKRLELRGDWEWSKNGITFRSSILVTIRRSLDLMSQFCFLQSHLSGILN